MKYTRSIRSLLCGIGAALLLLTCLPSSALAAFWWQCPPEVVFFLLKWDQLYKIIPVTLRLHSWKWVRNVTRTNENGGI